MSVNREGGENSDRWAEVLKGWREGDGGGGEEVDERRARAVYKTQSTSTSLTQPLVSPFLQQQ